MPESGQTIAHYRIVEKIGQGGMGEVYLADDTTLDRKVALKFLPEAFTSDPERMARFEREAKLLASLNHPNIAGIYGLEQADGNRFLVLEYVEGETLQARLSKGALPLEDALELCRQIAEGLEAAHEKGVIHRDLKPANVMITAEEKVKILDFGLAKALADESQIVDPADSPTITAGMTSLGVVLGTAAYMSPEQAKGKSVDKRADIWAFGCILYECLTGKKAFEGETVTETLAGILKVEPELEKVSLKVRPLLRHCLKKNPKHRLRDIGDAAALIEITPKSPLEPLTAHQPKVKWIWPAIAAILAIILAVQTFFYLGHQEKTRATQFHLNVPPMPDYVSMAVSPDGRLIAYIGLLPKSVRSIFVCEIGSVNPTKLKGTDGAQNPFWSPDSRSIAFVAGNRLKKIDVSGGPPTDICSATRAAFGGTWGNKGDILFVDWPNLYRVSEDGGERIAIGAPDTDQKEFSYILPHFLPDGNHYLFSLQSSTASKNGVYLSSLDSKEKKLILPGVVAATVYADPGYILFLQDRTLIARSFDAKDLSVDDESFGIADNVLIDNYGRPAFSVSQNGILIFRTAEGQSHSQFVWLDRDGKQLGPAGKPGKYPSNFDLSPDERRIVVSEPDPVSQNTELWIIDIQRNDSSRFTFKLGNEGDAVWSPDGLRVGFTSHRNGKADIYEKEIGSVKDERILIETSENDWMEDWSQDGKYIIYLHDNLDQTIRALPISSEGESLSIIESPFNLDEPHLSFDSKWLAYNSNESGIWEVYVAAFPVPEQIIKISTDSGVQPRWREDGKELFYLTLDGKMMAVDIRGDNQIEPGNPYTLFETELSVDPIRDQYEVTRDGQRFLLLMPLGEAETTPITVTLNWTALLE